jgi:hypothetical protein
LNRQHTPIEFLMDKSIFTAYIAAKNAYHNLQEKKEREYYSRMQEFGVTKEQIEDYTPEQEEAANALDKTLDSELGELYPLWTAYTEKQQRAYKEVVRFTYAEAITQEQRELAEFMACITNPNYQQKMVELTCRNLGLRL